MSGVLQDMLFELIVGALEWTQARSLAATDATETRCGFTLLPIVVDRPTTLCAEEGITPVDGWTDGVCGVEHIYNRLESSEKRPTVCPDDRAAGRGL